MFCADYVMAFVYHTIFTCGAIYTSRQYEKKSRENVGGDTSIFKLNESLKDFSLAALGIHTPQSLQSHLTLSNENKVAADGKELEFSRYFNPFGFGVASGFATSLTLYPFDFVRSGVMKPGIHRVLSAGSTVPYAGMLFGLYFRLVHVLDFAIFGRQYITYCSFSLFWALGNIPNQRYSGQKSSFLPTPIFLRYDASLLNSFSHRDFGQKRKCIILSAKR